MGKPKKSTKKFRAKKITHKKHHNAPKKKEVEKMKVEKPDQVDTVTPGENLGNVTVDEFMDEAFFSAIDGASESEDEDLDAKVEDEEDEEDELESHFKTLESLKQTDPAFYEYLQKNDQELLNFEDKSDEDDEEKGEDEQDEEQEEAEDGESKPAQTSQTSDKVRVTSELLKTWAASASKGGFRATRQLVLAFRAACHCNDEDADSDTYAFIIDNSSVFNQLILFCLRNMHKIFNNLLNYSPNTGALNVLPNSSPRWKRMQVLVRGYLSNVLYFMQQMTDPKMVGFILKSTEHLIPYIAAVPNSPQKFLKCFLTLWGEASELVRILAFLNIHKLALRIPYPFINTCLKGLYLTYVRNSKFTHANNYSTIDFMANCVVELYSIDPSASYMHAFVYIRQLALHLKNALMMKTKDAHINVYNWQYINSIRVWARLLSGGTSGGAPAPELRPLIYPLVQLIFGAISLVPTARYYPLRFICIRLLLRLAEANHIFINVLPYLLQVLEGQDFKKTPRPSTVKPIVFQYNLKAGPSLLNTAVYTKGVYAQVMDLLIQAFAVYSHSVAFPELVVPALVTLKKFQKTCKNVTYSKEMQQLIEKVEANVAFIRSHRAHIGFTAGWAAKASEGETKVAAEKKSPMEIFRTHKEQFNASLKRALPDEKDEDDDDALVDEDEEEAPRPPAKRRKNADSPAEKKKQAKAALVEEDEEEDEDEDDESVPRTGDDIVQDFDDDFSD